MTPWVPWYTPRGINEAFPLKRFSSLGSRTYHYTTWRKGQIHFRQNHGKCKKCISCPRRDPRDRCRGTMGTQARRDLLFDIQRSGCQHRRLQDLRLLHCRGVFLGTFGPGAMHSIAAHQRNICVHCRPCTSVGWPNANDGHATRPLGPRAAVPNVTQTRECLNVVCNAPNAGRTVRIMLVL
jgi:hypothetical protein